MTQVVNMSGNQDIDGLFWGWEWGTGGAQTLTFSFPTGTAAEYPAYTTINNFTAFNAAQTMAVRTALADVASFCNLTFTETTAAAATLQYAVADSINYTDNTSDATHTGLHTVTTAEANPPELAFNNTAPYSPAFAQGDSWYNRTDYNNPVLGSFADAAGIMHETGHNLGLKHGHVTQDGHGVTFPMLPADHNSYEYSVMTYSQFPGDNATNGDNALDHPTTYMQDDIAALQYMYGANYGATAHNGDSVYTWSTTTGEAFIDGTGQGAPQRNFVLMTIWDGGGTDTYDFSNYTTNLSVDLNPGAWTVLDTSAAHAQRADLGNNGAGGAEYFARGNIANALIDPNNAAETASLIEKATGGSGSDVLFGNAIANTFRGGGGNDTIDGRDGADTVIYSGARSEYATSANPDGSVLIADHRFGTPDGTDAVSNVEFFQFSNRTYSRTEVLNQPPVAAADSNGTAKNSTLSVSAANGVLANDTDPDVLDQGHLFVSQVNGSAGSVGHVIAGNYGSVTIYADGSYVYVADKGSLPAQIVAEDKFDYTVADTLGGTDTSSLSVVVFNPGVRYQAGINTTLNGGNGPDVLDGSAGHDILIGGNGPDVLIGGDGDTLTGGTGPDTFLFRPEFGANTITDFNVNNDVIQFDKSLFASVADILHHTTDSAGGAVITDTSGDAVTLVGVNVARLQDHMTDFHLV